MALLATISQPNQVISDYFTYKEQSDLMQELPTHELSLTETATRYNLDTVAKEVLMEQVGKPTLIKQSYINDASYHERFTISENGIHFFSNHYYNKYKLPIRLLNPTQAIKYIMQHHKSGSKESFTIVVSEENFSHVVPLYCHYSQKDSKLYILVMDSIEQISSATEIGEKLAILNIAEIIPIFSIGYRQIGFVGCKVDALTTLKTTHFVLNNMKVVHLLDFIGKTESHPLCYYEDKTWRKHTVEVICFKIPSCFVPAAERLDDLARGAFEDIAINRKGVTAKEQRAKYSRTYERTLSITNQAATRSFYIETKRKTFYRYGALKEHKMIKKAQQLSTSLNSKQKSSRETERDEDETSLAKLQSSRKTARA
ncbi:MAG: hypothetical protein P0S95_05630 [Rhabdochlamydiaceae bacterium]|nr:hypothetical protein [Candidatus Amphrikana amoebophyrae]